MGPDIGMVSVIDNGSLGRNIIGCETTEQNLLPEGRGVKVVYLNLKGLGSEGDLKDMPIPIVITSGFIRQYMNTNALHEKHDMGI